MVKITVKKKLQGVRYCVSNVIRLECDVETYWLGHDEITGGQENFAFKKQMAQELDCFFYIQNKELALQLFYYLQAITTGSITCQNIAGCLNRGNAKI